MSTLRLILEVSTHVTKSSIAFVTWNAGSVTVSVPTRTWPCSINVHASFSVSAILSRTITTESRRRQNALAASFSVCTRLFFVGMTPMLSSLRTGRRQSQAGYTSGATQAWMCPVASGYGAGFRLRAACQEQREHLSGQRV
eukprot:359620-Chlamydomonas_euryale.AAC.6